MSFFHFIILHDRDPIAQYPGIFYPYHLFFLVLFFILLIFFRFFTFEQGVIVFLLEGFVRLAVKCRAAELDEYVAENGYGTSLLFTLQYFPNSVHKSPFL